MMKCFSLFLLSFLFSSLVLAANCQLPANTTLVIGCSYDCGPFYRLRLTLNAFSLGYSLKVVDLRELGDLKSALSQVDGVLMPGGADINPSYYLDKVSPELKRYVEKNMHLVRLSKEGRERDPFEGELLAQYSADEKYTRLPLLGICRGMQMMSVTQGIPLYLDLETETKVKNRKYVFDEVKVSNSSLMQKIYKGKSLRAMKLHHQGLRLPYFRKNEKQFPLVKVTAFSHNNKIAESIEYTHRPALGVQYHPEMSFSSAATPVFKWFLSKSCEYKNSLKGIQ